MHHLYTDGSCLGNPGPGGWAYIVLSPTGTRVEGFGHSEGLHVTNNQMEMTAVIEGLSIISEGEDITVYSDSQYVINCFNKKWYVKWRKNNWRTASGNAVLNPELWEELLDLAEARNVIWVWVRGHAGNKLNEEVDILARTQANESKFGSA